MKYWNGKNTWALGGGSTGDELDFDLAWSNSFCNSEGGATSWCLLMIWLMGLLGDDDEPGFTADEEAIGDLKTQGWYHNYSVLTQ